MIEDVEGWCDDAKAQKLTDLILTHRPKLAVEIGVYGGSSLIVQALALQGVGGTIVGIDPWETEACLRGEHNAENRRWWSTVDLERIYRSCIGHIERLGLTNVKLMRMTSEDAEPLFLDGSIDLLHIDGNHSEEASHLDCALYLPKIKSGGHIVYDDVNWRGPRNEITTAKGLKLLLRQCQRVDQVATCVILRKG